MRLWRIHGYPSAPAERPHPMGLAADCLTIRDSPLESGLHDPPKSCGASRFLPLVSSRLAGLSPPACCPTACRGVGAAGGHLHRRANGAFHVKAPGGGALRRYAPASSRTKA